jgi:hypothetical protein
MILPDFHQDDQGSSIECPAKDPHKVWTENSPFTNATFRGLQRCEVMMIQTKAKKQQLPLRRVELAIGLRSPKQGPSWSRPGAPTFRIGAISGHGRELAR